MYDTTLGRFISRDPIGVWGEPRDFGNAYEYVGDEPSAWSDAYGLGQQVVVGAIKYGKDSTDAVDKDLMKSTTHCKSYSAVDFYNCVNNKYVACMKSSTKATEAEKKKECCIEKLVRDGHSLAGLGGQEGFDKIKDKIPTLKNELCPDAVIVEAGCYGYDYTKHEIYVTHIELAMLLTQSGGTYKGWAGGTQGLYPDVSPSTPKNPNEENKAFETPISPGESREKVKEKFDKVKRVET
jgi:hypothetical protein